MEWYETYWRPLRGGPWELHDALDHVDEPMWEAMQETFNCGGVINLMNRATIRTGPMWSNRRHQTTHASMRVRYGHAT
jgi:hypothetical protein